jgi:hypothetical protein
VEVAPAGFAIHAISFRIGVIAEAGARQQSHTAKRARGRTRANEFGVMLRGVGPERNHFAVTGEIIGKANGGLGQ